MISKKVSDGFIIRLEKGELITESLLKFCNEKKVTAGWISGLGGALWAEIAFYHLDQQAYEFERIDEDLEIASMTGNVAVDGEKTALHIHVVVSDENYHSYSGHLKEAAVAGTCEVYLKVFSGTFERIQDQAIGLKLMDL